MNRKTLVASALVVAIATLAIFVRPAVTAEPAKDAKAAAAKPEMKLPPGWTEADLQACMLAGTPGKMQEYLAKDVGVWRGKNTMWMGPDGPAMKSDSTSTVTSLMGGRYVQVAMAGEMPGMGPYTGMGLYAFDNVSQKFTATWIDNQSTGIMTGVGELSADGKVMTWSYTFNCPLTKKPAVLREVDTITGPKTKTLEMFGADPKSGKEYKMMSIELTKE
jgi:hypothetical protein